MPDSPTFRRSIFLLIVSLYCAPLLRAEEVILQYFNTDWTEIERRLPEVAEAGYTSMWLPPPFKGASGTYSVGFDTFDRQDIGDKDQMGTVRTRYGTGAELISLVTAAHRFGIRVYFDNVMAHNGGPLSDDTNEGELFPDLPGFVPQDFHLGRDGDRWRKFSDSMDWQDEWQVLNRNPFGWDIAHEDWNTSFDPDGLSENNDYPKWRGIRHPGQTRYYLDRDLPVASNFPGDDVYTFADKEPFTDSGYGAGNTGAGNGRFDWNDADGDGQHDAGEAAEPFTDTGIDPSHPDRQTAAWGYGDGVYNMGDPVDEDVNELLFRQVRWFVDAVKPDGFRLDAVKHVPSFFFGKQDGADKDYVNWGYSGQIQEQHNVSRGHTDWGNHRNTVYQNTLARDDSLLFGEHLGAPPAWPPYLAAGMRIANDDFLNAVGGFGGIGNSLAGYDQPGFGTVGTVNGMSYPLSHDNNYMDGSIRGAAHQFMLTREGLGIVYTDGYNIEGPPSYFPKPSYIPFLGQYGDQWVTGPLRVRRDFVRGSQIPRWSDTDFAAWEMRDKRENSSMSNSDGTVLMVMLARPFTGGQSRGVQTDFPVGARLRNYSEHGGSFKVNVGNDGKIYDDGGNHPLVPSGGYFAFSWDNPRPPAVFLGDSSARPIEIYQNGNRAPTMQHERTDGADGDPAYAHSVTIPRITDGTDLSFIARADGSTENILMRLDGGIDINSAMSFGPSGSDKRDNPPPKDVFFEDDAADITMGYEQMRYVDRTAEKFAATDVSRNVIGSAGAETWQATLPATPSRNNGGGVLTDTGSVDWVYHDPTNTDDSGTPQFVVLPSGSIQIITKIGYEDDDPAAAWVYYTTGGSNFPEGSLGVGDENTQVAVMTKLNDGNPDGGGTPEWWQTVIPSLPTGTVLRYKIGVHRENAASRFPFDQRDIDIKRKMETQFEVTDFDATAVDYFPHNDHGEIATGLSEGFHILRTKAFLNRTGSASIFHTEAQTFYYDTARPAGQVLFPADGDSIGGSTYGAVVTSDATVTEVCYSILDSDPGNDSATNGNGAGNWANAYAQATPTQLGSSGLAKEWRFDYLDIPSSGTAQLLVRFKELSSSTDLSLSDTAGHYTTITLNLTTGLPVNYRFGFPMADDETIGAGYVAKVLFDQALGSGITDTAFISEFTVTIDGNTIAASALSIIRGETAADDALAIVMPDVYDGTPANTHEVRVVHSRGDSTLTTTRDFLSAVSDLPDTDGDGLPDAWELANSLEFNNPTGVHGADGDFDADGVSNLAEYLAGTNPLLFEQDGFYIDNISAAGGDIQLTFPVIAGRRYRVFYSDDLAIWSPTPGFDILTGNPTFQWTDDGSFTVQPPLSVETRFYRVEISEQ